MLRLAILLSVSYFAVSVAQAQELTCYNPETRDAYISYTGSCMMGERQLIGEDVPHHAVDEDRAIREDRPVRPMREQVREQVREQAPPAFNNSETDTPPDVIPVAEAPEHAVLPEIEPHPVGEVTKTKVMPGKDKDKDATPAAPVVTADAEEPKSVVKYDTTFYNSYLRAAEEQNVLVDVTHRRITWHKGYKDGAPQYFYDASLDDLAPETGAVRGDKQGPIVFLDDAVEKPGNPYYTAYFLYFHCATKEHCIRERYVENGEERATRQLSERGIGFHSIQDAKNFMAKYLSGPTALAANDVKAAEPPKKEKVAGDLVLSTQDWASDPGQKLLVASNTSKDKTYVLTSYTISDCRGIISQQCATATPQTEIEPGHSVNLIVVAPGDADEFGKTPRVSFSLQWTYEDDAHKEYKGALDSVAPVAAAPVRERTVAPVSDKVKGDNTKRKISLPQDS